METRFSFACLYRRFPSKSNISNSPAVGTSGKEKDDIGGFDVLNEKDDSESIVFCSNERGSCAWTSSTRN